MSNPNHPCTNPVNRPLFFSDTMQEQMKAAEMCLDCPFMVRCGELGTDEAHGVWGGVTEWERPDAKIAEAKRLKEAAATERLELRAKIVAMADEGRTTRDIAAVLRVGLATVQRAKDAEHSQRVRNKRKAAKATSTPALSAA